MSEAIQVLVDLASNATLDNQENITTMLAEADISLEQEQAIIAKDINMLSQSIKKFPTIKCFAIVPAEDDEPENSESNEESETTNQQHIVING